MTNTLARMTAVFNEWKTRDEAELLAVLREDGTPPQSMSERAGLYFTKIIREMEQAGKIPVLDVQETEPVVEAAQPSLHAQVGNKVTSGMGNLFGGTSWGR